MLFLSALAVQNGFGQATLTTVGGNTHYCQGTAGVQFQIEGSINLVTYYLKKTGSPGSQATVEGNGATVIFPGTYEAGTYYVNPTPPTNNVVVIMDPLPTNFTVSTNPVNGEYCAYPGAPGVEISISTSQSGVMYKLYKEPSDSLAAWTGDGGQHSFGYYTVTNNYYVTATFPSTGCIKSSAVVTVTANTPPTADFTTSSLTPPPCANDPVTFYGLPALGVSYLWRFYDDDALYQNQSTAGSPAQHVFEAWGNATHTFNIELRITDTHGCKDSITKPVTIKDKPDATLNEASSPPNTSTFTTCSATQLNPNGNFTFSNGSTTLPWNTNYAILFGLCSTPSTYNQTTFTTPINVAYNCLGNKTLTYTVNGQNGCNNTRLYNVFIGSTPGGGILNPGNTYGLVPFLVQFPIDPSSYQNTPGTTYFIEFGDGTDTLLTQSELPPLGTPLEHIYSLCSNTKISCTPPSTPNKFAFKATCTAQNPCNIGVTSVCPIIVSRPPNPGFGPCCGGGGIGPGWWPGDPDPNHIVGCNPVTFNDTTTPGLYIYSNGTDTTSVTYYLWDFGDPASLAANTSQLKNPTHTFTNSGITYTITLITWTGGSNGTPNFTADTVIKQIYIQTQPIASFEIDYTNPLDPDGCVPDIMKIINNSDVGGLGIPQYRWSVRYANGNPQIGNISPGVQVITPGYIGDTTYSAPWFEFTASGRYKIIMTLINSCDTVKDSTEVLVCALPEVAFSVGEIYYCGPGPRLVCPQYDLNCDSNTISYHWTVNNPVTFLPPTATDSACPVIDFPSMGDYQVTAEITNSCGVYQQTQLVHVTSTLSNNTISCLTMDVCSGTFPILISGTLPAGGIPSYLYQWEKNTGGGWIPVSTGGGGQNFNITEALTQTTWFRRNVYDQGDCSDVSNEIQITVYNHITTNQISADQQICQNSTPVLLTGTQPTPSMDPITFQWWWSTDGITYLPIIGATSKDFQPPALSQTTWYYREAISAPCPSDPSSPVMIMVCTPVTDNTISANQLICQGTTPAQLNGSLPTSTCSTLPYQWQISTDNSTFTDISGSGGISQNYLHTIPVNVTTYFRRKVLLTSCPESISNVVTIDIMPKPNPNAGTDTTINNGTSTTLSVTASGGTLPYSYHWEPIDSIASNPDSSYITTNPLSNTTVFTATVTDANGCVGTDDVTVYVTGNALSVTIIANPTIVCPGCPNGIPNLCANATGGSGNYTYNWTWSGGNSTQQCIDVCPSGTTVYTVSVWDGYTSASANQTITVNPIPVITSPLSVCICSGNPVNYTPVSTVPGTTFFWSTSPGSCNGNTSGSGTTITDVLTNTGNSPCMVTYNITPLGPDPTNCIGQTVQLDVQVMPVAGITNILNQQIVISGNYTSVVNFTSNVAGATFDWQFFNTTCPGYANYSLTSGSGPMPSQIVGILPGGPPSCTITYMVTPKTACSGGLQCFGTPWYYNIIINSQPTIYNLLCPQPVCQGQSVTITLDDSDLGIDYMLYKGPDSVPPAKPGTGNPLPWINITTAGSYSVKATNPGNSQSVWMNGVCQVVINPNPAVNYVIGSTGNCPGDMITLNGSQSGVIYELFLYVNSTGITRTGPGPLNFGPQLLPGVYTIKATNIITGCWVWINGSKVIAPNPQQFLLDPAGDICAGDEFSLENSEPGITYVLECYPTGGGPTPQIMGSWIGNNSPISFGFQNIPGTYKVHAYNLVTLCDVYMADEKIIWANPIAYNILPDPALIHCDIPAIGLDNSQTGYTYYVHRINVNTGIPYDFPDPNFLPQTGTNGQPLSFAPVAPPITPWTYVIIGWEPNFICSTVMNGELTVNIGPAQYWMNPVNTLCIDEVTGQEITLQFSDLGINYTLTNDLQTVLETLPGGPDPLSFGVQTQPGTYTIMAENPMTNCSKMMFGNLTLLINPTKYTMLPQGPACPGAEIKLNGSDTGITYTLYPPIGPSVPKPGTGNFLTWGQKYQTGTYYITAQSNTTPCSATMNGTVVINPKPTVYNVKDQGTWCEPKDIGMVNSAANVTYEIMRLTGGVYISVATHLTTSPGPFWFGAPQPAGTYRVKATNVNGCDTMMLGSVVIQPLPTVDAGPASIHVCSIPPYSVSLSGTASNYSTILWSSPTNPGGSNFSPSPDILTPTYIFTPQDLVEHQVVLTLTAFGTGTCTGTSVTDHITVHIDPPIVTAGVDQVVCENEPITLNGTITGGTTAGIWTGGLGQFNPNPTTLNAIYTPDLTEAGTTVTLTLTTTDAAPCADISDSMTVTIYNQFIAGTTTANQTICSGSIPLPIVATLPSGGSTFFTYQWQNKTGTGSWTDITGSNTLSYSPPSLTATTLYRLKQTDIFCSPGQIVYTNTVTMTVNDLTANTISSDQTICENATAALSGTIPIGSGTISYQWQLSSTGLPGSFNDINFATSQNYTTDPLTNDSWYQRIAISTLNLIPCISTSNSVKVTVNNLVAGVIAADQTICENGTAALTGTIPTCDGTITYQWQSSLTGVPASFTNIPGATFQNYTTDPLTADTWFQRITTSTLNGIPCSKASNSVKVTVNNMNAGTIAADQTICENGTAALTGTIPTAVGVVSYQWQSSSSGVSGSFTNILNATSQNYTTTPLTSDTWFCRITTSTLNLVLCTATSNTVLVTVNNLTAGVIAADQTICENGTAALTGDVPTANGVITYQWQSSSTGLAGSFSDITSATFQNYTTDPLTSDTWFRRVAKSTLNLVLCISNSNSVKVTVNNLTAGTISADQTICENGTATLNGTVPFSDGTISYQWQSSSTGLAGSFSDITSATFQNYTTDPLTSDTWFQRIAISTLNLVACNSTSNIVKVTVNNLTAGTIASNQTICENETVVLTGTIPSADGTISYQWQLSSTGLPGSFNDINFATSQNYTTDPLTNDSWYQRIATSILNNIPCNSTSNVVTILVVALPVPTITPVSGNNIACINSTYSYFTEPGMTGYSWTVSPDGTIISGLGTNTLSIKWTTLGTKTITVIYTDPVTSCSTGAPAAYTVNVVPLPIPTITGPLTPCAYSSNNIYYTESGMTNYAWTVNGGTYVSGPGLNEITVTWGNPGLFKSVNVNYIGPGGCPALTPTTQWIIVVPLPTPTISGPNSVCVGTAGHTYTTEANMTSYSWVVSSGGTITSGGSPGSSSVTVTWNTTGTKTVSISYTNEFGCAAASPTVYNVNVYPLPVALLAGPDSVCEGTTGVIYYTTPGMTNYLWAVSSGGTITGGGTPTSNTVTITWNSVGPQNVSVGYTNENGCESATPAVLLVLVSPNPVPVISGPDIACAGDSNNVYFTLPGQLNYLWNISAGGGITAGSTTNSITVTWNTPGAKTVSVNYTNSSGCSAQLPTVFDVTVNPSPDPTITGPDAVCVDSTGNIYTTEAGMSAYTWTISPGNSYTGGGTNTITVTWNTPGAQTISVNYTSIDGCRAVNPTVYNVYVNTLPQPIISGPDSVCEGSIDNLYTTQSGMTNYIWEVSAGGAITAGGTSTSNTAIITWNTVGPQTVSVNYSNAEGCDAPIPVVFNVMVNPTPAPLITGPGTDICAMDEGIVYYTLQGQSNYMWDISGGSITAGYGTNSVIVTWTTAGNGWINVNYTNTFGCSAPTPTVYDVVVNPLPEPVITGPNPSCLDSANNIYLTEPLMSLYSWSVSSGGNITSGGISTSNNATVTWNSIGSQWISINYTNSFGCRALTPTIQPITVHELPTPMFSYTQELCNDTMHFTEFSQPANGSNIEWEWDFGDGSPPVVITSTMQSNGNTSHPYLNNGFYTVVLKTTNMTGCYDTTALQVYKSHCIQADFTKYPDSLYCQNGPIIFTDSSSPVPMIEEWKWDFGDGNIRTYTSFTDTIHHTYSNPGPYEISLVISAQSGGFTIYDTITQGIYINPSPIAGFLVSGVCLGNTSRFINLSDSNGVSIQALSWNFGNPASGINNTSLLENPEHLYSTSGKFIATLTLENTFGCMDTFIDTARVYQIPDAAFSYSKACKGYDIAFEDITLTGDTTIWRWRWHFGDPDKPFDTIIKPNPTYLYMNAGNYDIFLKVIDYYDCYDTVSQTITVFESPIASFMINENLDGMTGKIKLINQSISGFSYDWDFGDGRTSVQENPIITYENDGAYIIRLVTLNKDGCYDTTSSIYEFIFQNLYVPNAFSPTNINLGVRKFKPIGVNLQYYHAMVFNKWGHLLWESTGLDDDGRPIEGWDGYYNGVLMPQDTYLWKINATFKTGKGWEGSDIGKGSPSTMGTVTLIR